MSLFLNTRNKNLSNRNWVSVGSFLAPAERFRGVQQQKGYIMCVRINPSILAADFANIKSELQRIKTADYVHVDVMDNHFVSNLTFGTQMVERIQDVSPIPLDVHLMISRCEKWAQEYARLGAFMITFHVEATDDVEATLKSIRARGSRVGIAFKPGTPIEPYVHLFSEVDQILVMTVEPGFGGQSFMETMMPKVQQVRKILDQTGSKAWLQVDGGITSDTIGKASLAGADTFVAGSAVFRADPETQIRQLRLCAQ